MKVLIIPDIHLKPWMFKDADAVMSEEEREAASDYAVMSSSGRIMERNRGVYQELAK